MLAAANSLAEVRERISSSRYSIGSVYWYSSYSTTTCNIKHYVICNLRNVQPLAHCGNHEVFVFLNNMVLQLFSCFEVYHLTNKVSCIEC